MSEPFCFAFSQSRLSPLMSASPGSTAVITNANSASTLRKSGPITDLINLALRFPPTRRALMAAGRQKILKDAKKLGVQWQERVAELNAIIDTDLEPIRKQLCNTELELPDYYLAQFHAYPAGNLGYLPALEGEVSSETVHAGLPGGDERLRGAAIEIAAKRYASSLTAQDAAPRKVLDLGCSVGLSSAKLRQHWPDAEVTGVDCSSEMLSVAAFRRPGINYVHSLAEDLPKEYENSFDVVSILLVLHECPNHALRNILRESKRVLRPGGMICVMDADPKALLAVPPPFLALFLSTEPWFDDHATRNIAEELENAGFCNVEQEANTPRHQTFTAFVPVP